MTLPDSTRIAGLKTVADWKAMKGRLDGGAAPVIWEEAFRDFFEARIDSRYFEPIKAIEKMREDVGEGFAIVALHCSLIEFLASTLEGKTYRFRKTGRCLAVTLLGGNSRPGDYEYSDSRKIFVEFLRNRTPFAAMFPTKKTAEDFYKSVRCGLLHEARTKGPWKIRVCESATFSIDAAKKIIYRNKMQAAFEQFVNWYEQALPTDAKLQKAFIRKIDSLCEE
jgi:hypothetical protein